MGLSVSGATKSISKGVKSVSNAVKSASKVSKSLAKGDIKGAAGGVSDLAQIGKNSLKDSMGNSLGLSTGIAGGVAGLTGNSKLQQLVSNFNKEGNKGINTYGDAAVDAGANYATGGTYGVAQQMNNSLAQGGLGAVVDPKALKVGAAQAVGSYTGLDPNSTKFLQNIAQGNSLQKSAAQTGASSLGLDPTSTNLLKNVAGNGRLSVSDATNAYVNDAQNQALDAAMQKAGVKGVANQAKQAVKGYTSVADKFMKDANGKTLMGANNAPIRNPNFDSNAYDERQAGIISEDNEPGMMSKAWQGIKGGINSAGDFINENPLLSTGIVKGAASGAGYLAGKSAMDEQQKLLSKQERSIAGVNALDKFKFDPNREQAYNETDKFLQQRIAGGGLTPEESQIRSEGDRRAARIAAAGRLAGIEQQARMGQGASGAGSALAASLSGAQSQADIQSQTNLAREASASQNLEKAHIARPALYEQKTAPEMQLASNRDNTALNRVAQLGTNRINKANILGNQAEAKMKLAKEASDLVVSGISKDTPLQTKANAAQSVANTTIAPPPSKPVVQSATDKFNQAGQKVKTIAKNPGQAATNLVKDYAGPMARQVGNTADEAKKIYDKFKNPFGK